MANRKERLKSAWRHFTSWLEPLGYSSSDYLFDRISILEQEVSRLRAEVSNQGQREIVRHH